MKPIIGISANMSNKPVSQLHDTYINYIPTDFEQGVHNAGGTPIIFPITAVEHIPTYVSMVDGIILVGGADISPIHYNEEPLPQLNETVPKRDLFELELIKEAIKQKKPIFGICRGMQMINVAKGGTLYQDIYSQLPVINNHLQEDNPTVGSHIVQLKDNSTLQSIVGNSLFVNTLHHQAIKSLGEHLKVTAYSEDNIVEIIESTDPSQFILGVQWHPEILLQSGDIASQQLFHHFIQQCQAIKLGKLS